MTRRILLITAATLLTVNVWGQWSTPDANGKIYYNGGNVGIGTTIPIKNFTLSSSADVYLRIQKPNYSDFLDIGVATHTGIISYTAGTVTNSNLQLRTNNSTRLYVQYDGKIGIGTMSPQQELHLNGVNTYLRIDGTANSGLEFYETGNRRWIIDNMVADDRLRFYANGYGEVLSILQSGKVGIGTTNPGYKLAVKGTIGCGEIKVENVSVWADFVFEPEYKLMGLKELETYIQENKHLPQIPSEAEVKENGISVGEMNAKFLQKIEELTLYTIQQQEQLEKQNIVIENLIKGMEAQNKRIEELEK